MLTRFDAHGAYRCFVAAAPPQTARQALVMKLARALDAKGLPGEQAEAVAKGLSDADLETLVGLFTRPGGPDAPLKPGERAALSRERAAAFSEVPPARREALLRLTDLGRAALARKGQPVR